MSEPSFTPLSIEPLAYERELWESGFHHVAGVDEVGRGALAGPVVAAAVIFPPDSQPIAGVKDSKAVSAAKREALVPKIRARALSVGIGQIEASQIDEINILQATRQAMKMALEQLDPLPQLALVDGNQTLSLSFPERLIIKGDQRVYTIAAASIIAKVFRDQLMEKQAKNYPCFGFERHKGYGTKVHRQAIVDNGPSSIHRRSFLSRIWTGT